MVVLPNGARLGKGWAGSGYLTEPVESKKKRCVGFLFCFLEMSNYYLLSKTGELWLIQETKRSQKTQQQPIHWCAVVLAKTSHQCQLQLLYSINLFVLITESLRAIITGADPLKIEERSWDTDYTRLPCLFVSP